MMLVLGADMTPHAWRDTAVTYAMQKGNDPWEVAGFFGMTIECWIGCTGITIRKHAEWTKLL
jgi:hypothetical protein